MGFTFSLDIAFSILKSHTKKRKKQTQSRAWISKEGHQKTSLLQHSLLAKENTSEINKYSAGRREVLLLLVNDHCHRGLVLEHRASASHLHPHPAVLPHLHLQNSYKKSLNCCLSAPSPLHMQPCCPVPPSLSLHGRHWTTLHPEHPCSAQTWETQENFTSHLWYNTELKSWYRIKIPWCWLNLITWGKCVSIKSFTANSQNWKYFQLLILCLQLNLCRLYSSRVRSISYGINSHTVPV